MERRKARVGLENYIGRFKGHRRRGRKQMGVGERYSLLKGRGKYAYNCLGRSCGYWGVTNWKVAWKEACMERRGECEGSGGV